MRGKLGLQEETHREGERNLGRNLEKEIKNLSEKVRRNLEKERKKGVQEHREGEGI